MNNFKTREKEKLNEFCDYLTNVAKLSESTSNDYCKRIMTICSEEGIEIDDCKESICPRGEENIIEDEND